MMWMIMYDQLISRSRWWRTLLGCRFLWRRWAGVPYMLRPKIPSQNTMQVVTMTSYRTQQRGMFGEVLFCSLYCDFNLANVHRLPNPELKCVNQSWHKSSCGPFASRKTSTSGCATSLCQLPLRRLVTHASILWCSFWCNMEVHTSCPEWSKFCQVLLSIDYGISSSYFGSNPPPRMTVAFSGDPNQNLHLPRLNPLVLIQVKILRVVWSKMFRSIAGEKSDAIPSFVQC